MSTPRHTGRLGGKIIARSLRDALTLERWLQHRAPGLFTIIEEAESRFPAVRLGCCQAEANALADLYARGGREAQEGRDVLAGDGGWEE